MRINYFFLFFVFCFSFSFVSALSDQDLLVMHKAFVDNENLTAVEYSILVSALNFSSSSFVSSDYVDSVVLGNFTLLYLDLNSLNFSYYNDTSLILEVNSSLFDLISNSSDSSSSSASLMDMYNDFLIIQQDQEDRKAVQAEKEYMTQLLLSLTGQNSSVVSSVSGHYVTSQDLDDVLRNYQQRSNSSSFVSSFEYIKKVKNLDYWDYALLLWCLILTVAFFLNRESRGSDFSRDYDSSSELGSLLSNVKGGSEENVKNKKEG